MSQVEDPSDAIHDTIKPVLIRLADEGVPLAAIARSAKISSETVREFLFDMLGEGRIIEMPREDWPPNSLRCSRDPLQGKQMADEDIIFNCVRLFKITKQQASLLSVLIRRNEVSKDTMHQIIEQSRPPNKTERTDPKMVDVVICNLRRRLKGTPLVIETMWGCGYYMTPETRRAAMDLLTNYAVGELVTKKAVQ